MIIIGNDNKAIQYLKLLYKQLHIKDLGYLKHFIGIEAARSKARIVISPWKYTLEILDGVGLLETKLVYTPMEQNSNLKVTKRTIRWPVKQQEIS